jgi:hypothetical protein
MPLVLVASLLKDVLLLALLFLLGAMVTKLMGFHADLAEVASLAYPIGGGSATWVIFILSLAGLRLTGTSVALILVGVVALLFLALRIKSPQAKGGAPEEHPPRTHLGVGWPYGRAIVTAALVGTLLVAGWLSVGRSYSTYDATAGWAVKGYGIALEGDVRAASSWGMWGQAYPLNLSLQIGLFQFLDGDLLPGSKMIFPLYFVSLLLGAYLFWRRNRVPQAMCAAGLLFIAANPLLFLHGSLGFANLPFAVYLDLGVIYGASAVTSHRKDETLMSGLLLGLACWTRPEGIGYALGCMTALVVSSLLIHKRVVGLKSWILPIALIFSPWFGLSVSSVRTSQLGTAMGGVWPSLLAGQYNLDYLGMTFRVFLERAAAPNNWGFFIPMLIVFFVFGFAELRSAWNRETFVFAVATIVVALAPFFLFYVRSFTRASDFEALLIRSFDRAFIPGAVLLILLAVLVAGREDPGAMVEGAHKGAGHPTFE